MEIYNYFQRFDGYDVAIDTDPTNDVSEIKDVFISMQELGEHVQLNYEIKKKQRYSLRGNNKQPIRRGILHAH